MRGEGGAGRQGPPPLPPGVPLLHVVKEGELEGERVGGEESLGLGEGEREAGALGVPAPGVKVGTREGVGSVEDEG